MPLLHHTHRIVSFDTETALTLPGLQAPPMACMSWAERTPDGVVFGLEKGTALGTIRAWLDDDNVLLVGHNVAYDTVVLLNEHEKRYGPDLSFRRALFGKYEKGLIHDTMLREQLRYLAHGILDQPRGFYSLGKVAERRLGMKLDKEEDSWRYRYGQLIDVPLAEWPEEAKRYAHEDAVATLLVFEQQEEKTEGIPNVDAQCRAAFAFQLMRVWGMRTDPVQVELERKQLEYRYYGLQKGLQEAGIIRGDGSQDMKLTKTLIEQSYPGRVPLTEKGNVKTDTETIEACTHPALQGLSTYKATQKVLTTFVPVVERGVTEPICPYINTLVKNGRSSYRDPNLQNLPRSGGIRECFVPRPGKVFVDVDFDTLEVRTLAEVLHNMLGSAMMQQRYQQDPDWDPHSQFGALIRGIDYETALQWKARKLNGFKDTRQMSKAGVFGIPGGMGAAKFVLYAKASYGVVLDIEQAKWLKQQYKLFNPDIVPYFDDCAARTEYDAACIAQLYSGRIRGGMGFTDLANGWWSGLAADGAKHGLWEIMKRCWCHPESALFDSRPVVYIHDEYIVEGDEAGGHEIGMELARVAMEAMEVFTPNVPSRASPQLMRRWYKNAEPVYENGRLVPWEPKRAA